MTTFLRMLRFLRPWWRRCVLTGGCIVVYALLSGASVTLVSPFIRILFDGHGTTAAPATGGSLPVPAEARALQERLRTGFEQLFVTGDRISTLQRFCWIVLAVFILKNIFHYLQTYLTAWLEQRAMRDIRRTLYEHVAELPLADFTRRPSSSYVTPLVNDIGLMRAALVGGAASLLRNLLMIGIALAIIVASSWKLAVVAGLILPPNALLIAKLGRRLRRQSGRAQERMADMAEVVQETVAGARIVKAFGMHPFEAARFERHNRAYFQAYVRMRRLAALASPISELLAVSGLVAILWFGGRLVLSGELPTDRLFLFLTAMLWLSEPIKALIGLNPALQEGIAAGTRVFALLDVPAEPRRDVGRPARFDHELRFEAVGFGYDPARPVLRELDLVVRPGEIVALVGPSGAGKSTFVDLIPRFHAPTQGVIRLDGVDVTELSLDSLRSLIGIVSQDVILFNDTVRANIAYGRSDVPEEQILAAANAANAHDFIAHLPQGYDTRIGERGVTLSGGERQRLAIARAIVRDPQILILDEATSNLDTASERLIQEALERLVARRTVFVIAHRLFTVRHADVILVMDGGRIVERGTHDELVSAAGTYARLHALQFH